MNMYCLDIKFGGVLTQCRNVLILSSLRKKEWSRVDTFCRWTSDKRNNLHEHHGIALHNEAT